MGLITREVGSGDQPIKNGGPGNIRHGPNTNGHGSTARRRLPCLHSESVAVGCQLSLSSLFRSRSVVPPQTPKRSRVSRAKSRHSSLTVQVAQTTRAARSSSRELAKKTPGSASRHAEKTAQGRSSRTGASSAGKSIVSFIFRPSSSTTEIGRPQTASRFPISNLKPLDGRRNAQRIFTDRHRDFRP